MKKVRLLFLLMFIVLLMFSSCSTTGDAFEQSIDEVVVEDVYVPMRDGISLSARVFRPDTDAEYPVLLTRTPYGSGAFTAENDKGMYASVAMNFAKKGYVVVVEDVRGVAASEGEYYVYEDGASDGYDSVEWAAAQTWANGSVGTFGSSAMGITQLLTAPEQPEALKAMFVGVATSDYYKQSLFQNGAFRLEFLIWIASVNISNAAKMLENGTIDQATFDEVLAAAQNFPENYSYTPLADFPSLDLLPYFRKIIEHPLHDGSWDFASTEQKYDRINVPAYFFGGWYDIYADGPVRNFMGLEQSGGRHARGNVKLLMGPWTHGTVGDSPLFERDEVDIYGEEMQKWFDYWLKGIDTGIMDEDPVRYYTMGTDEWQTSSTWPVDYTATVFFLNSSKSGTIESLNDGSISLEESDSGFDSFIADPSNPLPTLGGQNFTNIAGPSQENENEQLSLTYTSEELDSAVEITGPVSAELYISSTAPDTDFSVKVSDVSPDGVSTLIMDRIQRASAREGLDTKVLLEEGEVYKLSIDLGNMSHAFLEGHRIRISISGSNFPKYDVNPNTGHPFGTDGPEDFLVAENFIYHSLEYPSAVIFPVVK